MAFEFFRRIGRKEARSEADAAVNRSDISGDTYISSTVLSVGDLFSDSYCFRLPWFQRAYAWREEHVKRLLGDIIRAQHSLHRRYFLGPIRIANAKEPASVSLIDGQQRLVTLSILFALLRDLAGTSEMRALAEAAISIKTSNAAEQGEAQFRVVPQPMLANFFATYIQLPGGTLIDAERDGVLLSESEQYVLENREHLKGYLLEQLPDEKQRNELLQFALKRCFVLVVGVDDEEEAWSMLSIEEETGLSFNSTERAKLSLIAVMPRDQQDEAGRIWEQCQALVGAELLRRLLGHVRAIKSKRRSTKPIEKDLAETFELNKDGVGFLKRELVVRAELLASIRIGAIGPPEGQRAIAERLKTLGWIEYPFWEAPLLHWLAERGKLDPGTRTLVERLERLAWLLRLAGADPTEQERRFIDVIGDIGAFSRPEDMPSLAVEQKILKAALKNLRSRTFYAKHYCGPVLRLLTLRFGNDPGAVNRTSLTIEHILPRNPSKSPAWKTVFPNAAMVADHANRLGNLVLLTPKQNQEIGTADFEVKREFFAKCQQTLAGAVAQNYSKWGRDEIMSRTEQLIKVLLDDWQLKQP